jgi:hypothetical protein
MWYIAKKQQDVDAEFVPWADFYHRKLWVVVWWWWIARKGYPWTKFRIRWTRGEK